MSFINPSDWIPEDLRKRIFDNVVNFIAKQTDVLLGKQAGDSVRKLTTDGEFIAKFNSALIKAQDHFLSEYLLIDREITEAISQDVSIWQAESVRQAILTIIQKPGAWVEAEHNVILQHFYDVLPGRFTQDRVDKAIVYFLKCLAQELWHLPALQRAYELQLQLQMATQLSEINVEIRGLRSDFRGIPLPSGEGFYLEDEARNADSFSNNQEKLQPSLMAAPPSNINFIGRTEVLNTIQQYWNDTRVGAVGVIGWGGIGKSSLVRHWVDNLITSSNVTLSGVFWWSFKEHTSIDEFLESLLIYINGEFFTKRYPTTASTKIQLLARELKFREVVIILDSVESMQFENPHKSNYGGFKSVDLRNFLNLFADLGEHNSKVFVISRLPLTDIAQYPNYRSIDLEAMSNEDGAELLTKLGVIGDESTLMNLVTNYGGHPLTLMLVAGFLVSYAGGSATRITEIPLPLNDANRYEALYKILEYYDQILLPEEHAFMMLFSAFRSPVTVDAFECVFKQPGLGLTKDLLLLTSFDFADLVVRLERLKLIHYEKARGYYSIHPLIRDYYCGHLYNSQTIMRETYLSLCNYSLKLPTPGIVDTLEKLKSKIDALYYACSAGDFNLAFDIWHNHVQQNRWAVQKQFCALSLDIELIELFMINANWDEVPQVTDLKKQAILINQLGYVLNRLGQTIQAIPLLSKAGRLRVEAEDWENAACSYFDLAEAQIHLGNLTEALSAAQYSIELARRGPSKRLYSATASLAWVQFLSGRITSAIENYQLCDSLEGLIEHDRGSVYIADRVHRVTFLFRTGQLDKAGTDIAINIELAEAHGWSDEIASCIRQSGDLRYYKEDYNDALEFYTKALGQAKTIGRIDEIVLCLISRAKVFIALTRFDNADTDLTNVLDICKKNGWRMHEIDAYIVIADKWIKQGELGKAIGAIKTARLLLRQCGYVWAEAGTLEMLGIIALRLNKQVCAKHYLTRALLIYEALKDPSTTHVANTLIMCSTDN